MALHLEIEWSRRIELKEGKKTDQFLYSADHMKLTEKSGIYIFGRTHGSDFEALYVGQGQNLRNRVRNQFKNLPLMLHLQKAKSGKRILLIGRFVSRPGQKQGKCLEIIEKAFIRHYLSEGHDLVNKQGTRLSRHAISSKGKHPKRYIPKLMFVDNAKREKGPRK